MRRKLKRCMAVMLAVSTMVTSVPVDYAFAEETGTEVEYTTEAITEVSSEGSSEDSSKTVIDLSGVTAVNETVALNSSESTESTEATPASEESHEDEDNGGSSGEETGSSETKSSETGSSETGSSETVDSETGSLETGSSETGSSETGSSETGSSETGSSEEDGSGETDDSEEVEKESNSQEKISTEGSNVVESESNAPESEETEDESSEVDEKESEVDESDSLEEDKESESEITPDSEDVPEEDADVEESEKVTSTLEISVNNGGKVIIKDSDGNVIKEVAAVDTAVEPVRIDREEGTVVTLEVVTESEAYNVAMYRLMTDTGEILQNTEYEEGMLSAKETFVFGSEKRCLMVSFTEVKTEEVPEVAPVQFLFSEGCEKIEVTCNGSSAEMPAMVSDEPLQAYFPTGTDIEMKLVAKEGYEVSYIELSTGDKSATGEIKFQLSSAEGVVVTTLCEKAEEGTTKKIKSVGPGTTYVFEEGKDGDAVATLKDGDVFEVEDASAVYILEMQPNDLSIPYTITRYEDGKQIDQKNNLWVQLNPGEGVSSYIGGAVFNESEVSEKYVCEYKSIESLDGIPTASGDNTEKTDPDFQKLSRTSGADMEDPKVGDVFAAKCKVTSHMYAFNYFASQAPLKVTITGGTDYQDMWTWFGGKTFKLSKCASTTSQCCPYYGTPGKLYFIVTKVTKSGYNTKVSGKLFFQNDYRNKLSQGYYWQNAHGTDSYNIYKVRIKKAVYELNGITTVTGIDYEQVYDKLAVFEIWNEAKSKKIETVTTDEKGIGYAANLEPSTTYYMKEIKAPEGAQLANGWWKMRVNKNGKPSSISYQGTTPGVGVYTQIEDVSTKGFKADNRYYYYKIKILKENGDGEWDDSLKGAKFEVHTSSIPTASTLVEEIEITGKETISSKRYPYGNTYYLFETKAPDGYKANKGYKKIRLDKEFFEGKSAMVDHYFTVEVPNTPDVTLTVNMDKGSNIPDKWSVLNTYNLVGAEYDVYSKESCTSSSYLGSLVVDSNGKGTCSIPYSSKIGDYIWLKEDKAPIYGGFAKDPNAIKVKVTTVDNTKKVANATHVEEKKYVDFNVYKRLTRDSVVGVADAQFTISVQGVAQGPLAGVSVYSWTFKTDSSGKLMTNPAGLISGPADALILEGGEYYFPCGYYYVSEAKAPDNCIKSEDVYFYDCSETIPENVKVYSPGDIVFYNEPNTGYLKIKKTNSNPTVTEGNSMYGSIGDAQFTVYSDSGCTNELGKIDINNDGTSTVLEVPAGTVYVKETTFPKGFVKDSTVIKATITKDQTTEISRSNKPLVGILNTRLVGKVPGSATNRGLGGAQFKVEFFGNDNGSGSPLKTWYIFTNSNGFAYLRSSSLVEGSDSLYGDNVLPLGYIKVSEHKAPEGYIKTDEVKTCAITQDASTGNVRFSNDLTDAMVIVNESIYGGVKVKKVSKNTTSAQGDATLAGATFAIIVNDEDSLTRFDTRKSKSYSKGEEIARIVTGEDGYAYTEKVTEGNQVSELLQEGNYIIKEVIAPEGYTLSDWSKEFTITENGQVVDLTSTPCENEEVFGGIKVTKVDSETRGTQGSASLKGAEFNIINRSAKSVKVNDVVYNSGEVVKTIKTDAQGIASTGEKELPYGTYDVVEVTASEGYLVNSYVDTVSIRTNGEFVSASTSSDGVWEEDIIHFDLELTKFKDNLSSEDAPDNLVSLEGIKFSIKNINENPVFVGGKEYASGEIVLTITTDENGFATTKDLANGCDSGALPYGKYLIHEENCPEELIPVRDFVVNGTNENGVYDGKVYRGIYLNNKPIESPMRIKKVDAETGKTIGQGATFQILDENKQVMKFRVSYPVLHYITEFTTNADGIVETPTKLPYGTYYLREIKAPYDKENLLNGYVLGEDIQFNISTYNDWENVIEVVYSNKPTKGKITVTKVDEDTNKVLPGATYAVFAEENIVTGDGTVRHTKGSKVDTIVIGADGTGTSNNLYLGKYYLQEIKAPKGYCLDTNTYSFVLKYDAENQSTEVVTLVREENLKNKPTELNLLKKDIDGELLDGVKFELKRIKDISDSGIANDLAVDGGTFTTSGGGKIQVKYLISGVYSLTEVDTLPGYVLDSTPRYVTVDSNGYIFESDENGVNLNTDGAKSDTLSLTWVNDYTKWDFSKVDVTGDVELEGATLEIYDSNGDMKYTWVSDGTVHRINKIPFGTYTLVEKIAPKGYVIANDIEFEVTNTGAVQKATMVDKIMDAYKLDEAEEGMVGAKLQVFELLGDNSYGNKADEWVTDGKVHHIENLKVGKTYALVEAETPEGWVLANPVNFTVLDDGKNQEVSMVDIRVKANKYDETKETYVEGATLEVRDGEGTVVDTWVTEEDFHYISGLVAGKSYTLVETKAPEGFAIAKPVNFTVEDNGKDQEVVMINKKVIVSKVDTAVIELAGAHLEVRDKDGNVVDSWVSDGTPHEIKNLVVGETYTLVETKAPEGYAIATPIEFTVADNAKNDTFNLINKQVFVSKTDITGDTEIEGAVLEVIDKDDNVVDSWVSGKEAHPISNIKVGETYTLHEELAPEGYVIASDIEFTVLDDFKVQKVVMKDKQLFVSKKEVTGDDELPGAKLTVKEKSTGNVVDSWTSTDEKHAVKGLKVNTFYILTEEIAPEGYVIASDIEFFVEDDFQIQEVTMKDKQVFMHKHDVTGEQELEGAEIKVLDKDGNVVDEWTSTTEPHAIKNLVVGETYVLHEEVAPEGFVIANDVEFTVLDDFTVQTVEMIDKQLFVSKKAVTGEDELEGAHLKVTKKVAEGEDEVVLDEWVSGSETHAVKGLKVGETYVLTETIAPEGYAVATSIEFTVLDDFTIQTVEMLDKQVFVSKKSVTGTEELEGAKLTVYDETGKVVDEWVSGKEEHPISNIVVGKTYTLKEETAPEGYVVAEEIKFVVEDDFQIQKVEMLDKQVFVSKKSVTGTEELEGAKLTVTDKETGKIVDEWTSGKEEHAVSGLEVKKTYILKEETAPQGFVVAEEIEFTVENDFKVQKVEMKDKQVFVSKKDVTGDSELPGATLTVIDKETGEKVDTWVSTNEEHPISGLEVKKTYILIEETAPEGFVVAEQIEFVVEDDFSIQHVEMKDKQVFVSKQDITTGEEIEGATLQVVDKNGEVVDEWVSEEGVKHPISGLVVGETYTLVETLAPEGYVTAEDVEFTVLNDFLIQEVVMYDDYTKVEISKRDATTGKELPGAKLILYDEDGEVVDEWTSGKEPHYIEYLPVGKYTLHEDLAPVGYLKATDVEFEVEDTGEVQQVVMEDEPEPVVNKIAQTGEDMGIFVGAGLAVLLGLFGLVLLLRRKKRQA